MSMYAQLCEKIKSQIALPQFFKVEKVDVSNSITGYTADGEILLPGSLESTGEYLSKVPIQIPGASQTGLGVFCKIDPGMIAIVQFIAGSKSYPIITGVYTEKYYPASAGEADVNIHGGAAGTIQIANECASLYTILYDLFSELMILKTVGSPATQITSQDNQANFLRGRSNLSLLMKE